METTRRGFLGRALAGLAALTAPVAAATQEVVALEPGNDEAIYSINPKETPFTSLCNGKPSAQLHEWVEDDLFTARIALDKYK